MVHVAASLSARSVLHHRSADRKKSARTRRTYDEGRGKRREREREREKEERYARSVRGVLKPPSQETNLLGSYRSRRSYIN